MLLLIQVCKGLHEVCDVYPAVHTRLEDWNLHLESLKALARYFFVQGRLSFARMVPLYISSADRCTGLRSMIPIFALNSCKETFV